MSELATALPRLQEKLDRAAAGVRQTTLRAAWMELLWRWLAGLAALFVLDLLLGLPAWLRWVALAAQVGFVGWSLRGIALLGARLGRRPEQTARVVEERHPELDNALINAVQFARSHREAPPLQAALMQREMVRAEGAAAGLAVEDAVSRDAERRALRLALAFAGAWLAAAVLFSSGVFTVLPRLFVPWMDDLTPPFSLTRFDVRPPGATIRTGESLNIVVAVSGPVPDRLTLMTRTRNTPWRRVALESLEPGRYSVTLTSLQEDTWFFVQSSSGRSARYRIRVLSPPKVESLRATYAYPEYTHQSPATETVGEAGIHALVRTQVTLEVSSNRPLRSGVLEIRTVDGVPQELALERDARNPARGTARFTLSRPGEFRVALTAEDGQTAPEAARGKIVVERDQRPTVWFSQPAQDLLVTPEMRVRLHLEAEDDHAVGRVVLHRVVNDLGDSPAEYPAPAPAQHVERPVTLDLAELGVRPGDEIKYYGSAYDNEPRLPNVGDSESFSIKVVTPEEYQEALKERAPEDVTRQASDVVSAVQDVAERQEKLAETLERLQKALAKNPDDPALKKALEAARAEQKALQDEARELQQLMREYAASPSSSDLEKALKQAIGQMAQQMAAASGSMQQAREGSPGSAGDPSGAAASAAAARRAARQMQAVSQQMQGQVQKSIEHLEQVMPLYQDLDRFMALLDRQGQLVLRARELQQKTSPNRAERARLSELEAEQGRIRQELKQLQEDLRRHADDAEKYFPKAARAARKIAGEIDERGIPDLMQGAQDRFRQQNGPEAFDRAVEALREMEAMVKECEGGQGSMEGELGLCLSRTLGRGGLGSSLGQIARGMGMGMGQGQGMGAGMGGMQAGSSGRSGGSSMRVAKAYVPGAASLRGGGGPRKRAAQGGPANRPAGLAPEDVELMRSPALKPPRAAESDPSRYPPEYKKLIGDYFRAVAERQPVGGTP